MSLPIIDLAPYLTKQINTKKLALQIRQICKQTGFFYVKNHGVPQKLQESILRNSQKFFSLPKQAKRQIQMSKGGKAWRGYFQVGEQLTSGKIDLKQGLYLGQQLSQDHKLVKQSIPLHGSNLFPKQVPQLKADILQWNEEMGRVGGMLMEGIAESLFLDRDYFGKTICKDHLGLLRIFHYPYYEQVEVGHWGVGEHTDYGLLTILMINDKGLQVKSVQNKWIKVDPIPNTFVINIGDILQKMTRGLYKSTPHRVMNTEKKSRYSIPYFYDPGWNSPIRELEIKIDQQEIEILKKNSSYQRWDKVDLKAITGSYGAYLMSKIAKVFPHLAQQQL